MHWQFDNYAQAWTDAGIGQFFLNTVIVVGVALVLVMLLGAMCAYVLARFTFRGSRFIYYLMLAGLTFPIFLAIVPLFFVLKNFGLINTLPGLIMMYVAFALPFTVFFLYAFFRTLPDECTRRRDRRRRGVANLLPDHAADGEARHGRRRDLQLPRTVEPVPAAGGPEHDPTDMC